MSIFSKLFGKKKDETPSKEEAAKSIKEMNATLCALANEQYNHGEYEKAFTTMRMVAEQGDDMDAMFNLGMYYIRGVGTEKNVEEGIVWLKKAAGKGDGQAAYNVAIFYHDGKIVERDLDAAVEWYKRSADLGNEKAKHEYVRLAEMLHSGMESEGDFDIADIVQQMLDEAKIEGQREENLFKTTVGGVHTTFNVGLHCDGHKLLIYAPFAFPVPDKSLYCVALETHRINKSEDVTHLIIEDEKDGIRKLSSITQREFDVAPTPDEIRQMMIHTIDIIDNENFRSLACSILGMATYEDVLKQMMNDGNKPDEDGNIRVEMVDGYDAVSQDCKELKCSRVCGRLLMLVMRIIKREESLFVANTLLQQQTGFDELIQRAYDEATVEERDVIRKLQFLRAEKIADGNDEAEDLAGRMEADAIMDKDIYGLLKGE